MKTLFNWNGFTGLSYDLIDMDTTLPYFVWKVKIVKEKGLDYVGSNSPKHNK
jgi:hypothetical protein